MERSCRNQCVVILFPQTEVLSVYNRIKRVYDSVLYNQISKPLLLAGLK